MFVAASLLVAAFSAERLLFEALFPRFTALGERTVGTLIALLLTTIACAALWKIIHTIADFGRMVAFAPLLLNLHWLLDPTVDLVRSRLIFGTSSWLVLLLFLYLAQHTLPRWASGVLLLAYLLPIYGATLGRHVGTADTFEFQVTAPQLGIAHPTGYPLYLMLGKLWTLLPFGPTIAMRLNVGTMVYALIAIVLLAYLLDTLFGRKPIHLILATPLALLPTFWSQAVEAEVYSLHAILVVTVLLLISRAATASPVNQRLGVWLALAGGLGMTNHVTTVLLLPAIAFILITQRFWRWQRATWASMTLGAFAPLVLYLYLPLRWQAVNGEPMGVGRLFEWVTGTRFAGALVWRAWLDDPTRWEIIGRIYQQEWGTVGLLFTLAGLIALAWHNWRFAAASLLGWIAFSFYALNYYVPDLNVFMLPALIIMSVWWAALPATFAARWQPTRWPQLAIALLTVGMLTVVTLRSVETYKQVDASAPNELVTWADTTLAQPLAPNAAILADSDKFPPLYYLQQAEGVRPDLEIMVLPDEAAYRAETDSRYTKGQVVYLTRYLPNLPYPMRSVGPLVELLPDRNLTSPRSAIATFDSIALLDVTLQPDQIAQQIGVALQWQATHSAPSQQLYFRWRSGGTAVGPPLAGRHPVQAYYPTAAWHPGEIVDDFHWLPLPLLPQGTPLSLELAVAPPFTPPRELDWVALGDVAAKPTVRPQATELRIWADGVQYDGATVPATARPNSAATIWLNGVSNERFSVMLLAENGRMLTPRALHQGSSRAEGTLASWQQEVVITGQPNAYDVLLFSTIPIRCGWFLPVGDGCDLGRIEISGVPLPPDATNYADQIALLDIAVDSAELTPGGVFELTLNWRSLAVQPDDYTVFVQILDQNDQIVGQIDSWPMQGTYPTTQWQIGETIRDPYKIQLDPAIASGDYRLIVGLYNLRDLRRLPVLDRNGNAIDDKTIIPNLYVP